MRAPLAISFDLDGTLASMGGPRLATLPRALSRPFVRHLGPAYEALRGRRHPDLGPALAQALRQRLGPGGALREADVDDFLARDWPAAYRHARCPAALLTLIRAIDQRGLPRLVLSDHPATGKLRALGLPELRPERWALLVDAGAYGALKPWPDALRAAAAGLGVPVGGVLHIGDRPETDGAMAAAAGAGFLPVQDRAGLATLTRQLASGWTGG